MRFNVHKYNIIIYIIYEGEHIGQTVLSHIRDDTNAKKF